MVAFAELTEEQRERLEMLIGDASAVIQICSRILRHGYSSYHPSNPDRSNKAILTTEPMQFWTVYERMAYHGEINRIIVKITEIAWDLYCRETKGAMSSVNTRAELGVNTRKEYLVKAAGKLGLSK